MYKEICNKYLLANPEESHPDYWGPANDKLYRDIEVFEVRTAVQELIGSSAACPDRATNKALKHLNEPVIASLTALFNRCWKEGKLPRKWKTAKTIQIPKQASHSASRTYAQSP